MRFPSDSMKTPAYPSGHSLQSRLVAEHFIKKYPEHKDGLIKAADQCGKGRVFAGWHFPSDHEAGVELAKQIYPKLDLSDNVQEQTDRRLKLSKKLFEEAPERYFKIVATPESYASFTFDSKLPIHATYCSQLETIGAIQELTGFEIFPNLVTTLTPDLFASLGCGQQYRNFKNEDDFKLMMTSK